MGTWDDITEAIVGMPADRNAKANFGRDTVLDLSKRNREFEEHMFPLNQVFDILRSRLIEPEHLRNDDFEAFFNGRMRALSEIVADTMGKPVVAEAGTDETERDFEFEDDEIAELEAVA